MLLHRRRRATPSSGRKPLGALWVAAAWGPSAVLLLLADAQHRLVVTPRIRNRFHPQQMASYLWDRTLVSRSVLEKYWVMARARSGIVE